MIEDSFGERLGTFVLFPPGNRDYAEHALVRLASLGIRHVRMDTPLDADGPEWRDWLLERLTQSVTILVRDGQLPAETLARCGDRIIYQNADRATDWLICGGYSTWRYDHAQQARDFLNAVTSGSGRVYWGRLDDAPGEPGEDDRAGQTGFFGPSGEPKLVTRLLLDGGVAAVQRVFSAALKAPAIIGTKPVLITGGAGFIGANLADRLASEGTPVLIYDGLVRAGVERNLHWLKKRHPSRITAVLGDVRDEDSLGAAAARAAAVFHLAGQVAVTTSMMTPVTDFEVNARGTLALLEALRTRNPNAPLVFASTNKVYGDLADISLALEEDAYLPVQRDIRAHGVDETRPLSFHTPYGCSKGTADQYVLDYAHSFGLHTAVLRMSCIYGERQLGTEDQGWVAHFLLRAIAGQGITIYGDGRQVRDVLHVGDAVSAYLGAWAQIGRVSGRAYNLGGGPGNAISLLQLIAHIGDVLGREVDVTFADWRPGDQRYFVANTRAARNDLGLAAPLPWRQGIARLAQHFGVDSARARAALAEAL